MLTFSRAAVARIQQGMRKIDQRPRARTFDSWALELLSEVASDHGWSEKPFDERIKAALEAITAGTTDDLFEGLRHVVLDEAQDLVGLRREMVQAMLDRYDCGFTVVGDLAQSIYGFQTELGRRATETGAFVRCFARSSGPS